MTKTIDEDKLLTFDIVKDFLRAIVELMLQFNTGSSQFIGKQSQYSSSKMQFAIAYSCKLTARRVFLRLHLSSTRGVTICTLRSCLWRLLMPACMDPASHVPDDTATWRSNVLG
jgi:hypothetical protein